MLGACWSDPEKKTSMGDLRGFTGLYGSLVRSPACDTALSREYMLP